jgi:hypothetical protein
MKVTKQSLKDWCVENDSHKTVAWIRKVSLGYEVSLALFDFKEPYFSGLSQKPRRAPWIRQASRINSVPFVGLKV